MKKLTLLLCSHQPVGADGSGNGCHVRPIVTSPTFPNMAKLQELALSAVHIAKFNRDLRWSSFVHRDEGKFTISAGHVINEVKLA